MYPQPCFTGLGYLCTDYFPCHNHVIICIDIIDPVQVQSNSTKMDTEGAIEGVHINGVKQVVLRENVSGTFSPHRQRTLP